MKYRPIQWLQYHRKMFTVWIFKIHYFYPTCLSNAEVFFKGQNYAIHNFCFNCKSLSHLCNFLPVIYYHSTCQRLIFYNNMVIVYVGKLKKLKAILLINCDKWLYNMYQWIWFSSPHVSWSIRINCFVCALSHAHLLYDWCSFLQCIFLIVADMLLISFFLTSTQVTVYVCSLTSTHVIVYVCSLTSRHVTVYVCSLTSTYVIVYVCSLTSTHVTVYVCSLTSTHVTVYDCPNMHHCLLPVLWISRAICKCSSAL
jgi:hypothetical protein